MSHIQSPNPGSRKRSAPPAATDQRKKKTRRLPPHLRDIQQIIKSRSADLREVRARLIKANLIKVAKSYLVSWVNCLIAKLVVSSLISILADHFLGIRLDASYGRWERGILEDDELLKMIAVVEYMQQFRKWENTELGLLNLADFKLFLTSIVAYDLLHKYLAAPGQQLNKRLLLFDIITVSARYGIIREKYRNPNMLKIYNKCRPDQGHAKVPLQEPPPKSAYPYTQNSTTIYSCRTASTYEGVFHPDLDVEYAQEPSLERAPLCTSTSMPATHEEVKKVLQASEEMCYDAERILRELISSLPPCYQKKFSHLHIKTQTLESLGAKDKSEHKEGETLYRVTQHFILVAKLLSGQEDPPTETFYIIDPAMGFLGGKENFNLIGPDPDEEANNTVLWFVEVEQSNEEKSMQLVPQRLAEAYGIFPINNPMPYPDPDDPQ